MLLENFLAAIGSDAQTFFAENKLTLVRHTMKHRKDGNWSDFDERLRFEPDILAIFTAEQPSNIFKSDNVVLVFVADQGTTCVFKRGFINKGIIDFDSFKLKHGSTYDEFLEWKAKRKVGKTDIYYDFEVIDFLKPFEHRLVIEWGKGAQSWYQRKIDKSVIELKPEGFVVPFPGWERVCLSHQALKAIIASPQGNPDWYKFLSNHDGVYVVLDKRTSKLYVGSAYSKREGGGIWGRWCGYANTGTNNNKGIVDAVDKEIVNPNDFVYSIHHVVPQSASSYETVLELEARLKTKLNSRSESNLNWN